MAEGQVLRVTHLPCHSVTATTDLNAGREYPYPGLFNMCYASPQLMEEVGLGVQRKIDYKSQDIWGMGCLLLIMLINRNPFLPSEWSRPLPSPVTPLAMQNHICEEMRLVQVGKQ